MFMWKLGQEQFWKKTQKAIKIRVAARNSLIKIESHRHYTSYIRRFQSLEVKNQSQTADLSLTRQICRWLVNQNSAQNQN